MTETTAHATFDDKDLPTPRPGSEHPVEVSHTAVYPSVLTMCLRFLRRNIGVSLLATMMLTGIPQFLVVDLYEGFARAGTDQREVMVTNALIFLIVFTVSMKILRFAFTPSRVRTPDINISYTITSAPGRSTKRGQANAEPVLDGRRRMLLPGLVAGWVAAILVVAFLNALLLATLGIEQPTRSILSLMIGVITGSVTSLICIRLYRRWK